MDTMFAPLSACGADHVTPHEDTPCPRRSGSPSEPSARSRRMPPESRDAPEDLPKERRCQVAFGELDTQQTRTYDPTTVLTVQP